MTVSPMARWSPRKSRPSGCRASSWWRSSPWQASAFGNFLPEILSNVLPDFLPRSRLRGTVVVRVYDCTAVSQTPHPHEVRLVFPCHSFVDEAAVVAALLIAGGELEDMFSDIRDCECFSAGGEPAEPGGYTASVGIPIETC